MSKNSLKYLLSGLTSSIDNIYANHKAEDRQNAAYERQLAEEQAKAEKEAQANNARTYSVGQLINGETPLPIDQASRYYAAVGGKVPLPQNERNSIFTNLDKEGRQLYEDTVKFNEPKKQPKTVISKVGENYFQHEEGTPVNLNKPDYTEPAKTVEYKDLKPEHVAGQIRLRKEKYIDGKLAGQEDRYIAPRERKSGGISYVSKDMQKEFDKYDIKSKVARAQYATTTRTETDAKTLADSKLALSQVRLDQVNFIKQSAPDQFKKVYDKIWNKYGKKDPSEGQFIQEVLDAYHNGAFNKTIRIKHTKTGKEETITDPGAESIAYFKELARALYGDYPDLDQLDALQGDDTEVIEEN